MKLISTRKRKQRVDKKRVQQRPVQSVVQPMAPEVENKHKKRKNIAGRVVLTVFLIIIISGAGFAGWYYWWTTQTAFEYRLQPVVILYGQNVSPEDFLYPGEDMELSAEFQNSRFNPQEGRQTVPLALTLGMRTINATAELYVLTPVEHMFHEFASPGPDLIATDFLSNAYIVAHIPPDVRFDIRFTAETLPLESYSVGTHTLQLALNDAPFDTLLHVTDTTPPTVTTVNVEINIGESVGPEDFIADAFDASGIESITFVEGVDEIPLHSRTVEIALADIYGNRTVLTAELTVLRNQTPPVIEGVNAIQAMVGSTIVYRRGVTAYDDFGNRLTLHIDNRRVDADTIGTYTVSYWAEDLSGQRTEVEVDVYIISIDPDEIDRQIEDILDRILTDDMTQVQQTRAIHRHIRSVVRYTATRGRPHSIYEGVHIALTVGSGNCYIYYSFAKMLLDAAGIENITMTRVPHAPSVHFWNLVNADGLGWYHFDAMPTRFYFNPQMYRFTSSQARYFASTLAELHGSGMYYTYDPDLYPDIEQ